MRWQTVVVAIGLGMVGGAGWLAWESRQAAPPAAMEAVPPPDPLNIPLLVVHDGRALRLRWNPHTEAFRNAGHGSLIIVEGDHRSTLPLDARELQGGLASYWPQASHVRFRLETDTGGTGSLDVPVNLAPGPAPRREAAAPPHRPPVARPHLDDGLEWTRRPPPPVHIRPSRWVRLKRKLRL
jgi:hypothetical protein